MSNIPQGKYENTIKECTKALELNPAYVKALVRRGEAHEKLEHFEEAIAGEFKFILTHLRFGLIAPDTASVWKMIFASRVLFLCLTPFLG